MLHNYFLKQLRFTTETNAIFVNQLYFNLKNGKAGL